MSRTLRAVAVTMLAAMVFFGSTVASQAEPVIMSVPDAADRMASGDLVLLDIRSPEEWEDSGVAEGAWPVSMHVDDFPKRLQAILQHYEPRQIGLICATGNRSSYIAEIFEQNGITGVINVSEGMFGNASGDGWIARGLPVVSAENALRVYDGAQKAWAE